MTLPPGLVRLPRWPSEHWPERGQALFWLPAVNARPEADAPCTPLL